MVPPETFDNYAAIDMITVGETRQQGAGREADALRDLS